MFLSRVRASSRSTKALAAGLFALAVPGSAVLAGSAGAQGDAASSGRPQLSTIFSGQTLGISQPDDIVMLGGQLFVGFQNGVGPQGQPSPTGNLDSTLVEMTPTGTVVHEWQLRGKIDGLGADPQAGQVIATVNEDLNSSLYTVDPATGSSLHYAYSPSPLPHNGGTDSVSDVNGQLFVAASAPGTVGNPAPQPSYPAVYQLGLDPASRTAVATPAFYDEATARIANVGPTMGQKTTLALTDPDSTEVVPAQVARFGGDFMLDSQGDLEHIFVGDIGQPDQSLHVLSLSQSTDDTAWATTTSGTLYMTDHANNLVVALRQHFTPGTAYVAVTPCGANSAPPTCTTPNYLGTLNPYTGNINSVNVGGAQIQPQGMLFDGGTSTGDAG